MAIVSVLEIEEIYGVNDTNRGNQMMAVAGEALLGYVKEHVPQHTVYNIQQKTIPADDIKKVEPGYSGEDISINDDAVIAMITEQAKMAGRTGEALVVGLRSVTPFFTHAARLSSKIKIAVAELKEKNPELKEKNPELSIPEVKIVIGGYHASGMIPAIRGKRNYDDVQLKAEELYIGQKYKILEEKLHRVDANAELVDAFVVGEGEETFLELINYYEKLASGIEAKNIDAIEGVVYRDDGVVKFNGRREEMRDDQDKTKEDYHKLTLSEPYRYLTLPLCKKDSEGNVTSLQQVPSSAGCTQVGTFPGDEDIRGEIGMGASRGCNHKCEFCSSGDVWCSVRFRDPKAVVMEAAKYWNDPVFRTNFIYFFDLTFNAQYEKHANELCEAMKNAKRLPSGEIVIDAEAEGERIFGTDDLNKIHWFCLSEVFNIPEGVDGIQKVDDALTKMAEAGCTKIGYGIEGFTPRDINGIKKLNPEGLSDEEIMRRGIEKFAKTAWVLKRTTEKGIFTRGYFMWGTANQDETSFDKAMALLTAEVPVKVFENMEDLKAVVGHLFKEQAKGEANPDIEQFVREKLGYSEEALQEESRLLEIDHLRIGYETPYPNTDVSKDKERKLRYYEYCRDEDGFYLHDDRGKLIPEYYDVNGAKLSMELREGKPVYSLDGAEIELAQCHKKIDEQWGDNTLDEAKSKGWDDWELLTQEYPILNSDIPIEDMEKHQKMFIEGFYTSQAYRNSMEHKAEQKPYLGDAIYAWQKFWNDRMGRGFNFLSEDQKKSVEERYQERLADLDISPDEKKEWIDKHFMNERRPLDDTLREYSGEGKLLF